MTDRELWVKTCKTVGAMVGATVTRLRSLCGSKASRFAPASKKRVPGKKTLY